MTLLLGTDHAYLQIKGLCVLIGAMHACMRSTPFWKVSNQRHTLLAFETMVLYHPGGDVVRHHQACLSSAFSKRSAISGSTSG